jgi:mRNA-degrading endonuclease toxin of MazEF toxin-antitoxin module
LSTRQKKRWLDKIFNKDTFFAVGLTGKKKHGAHYLYIGNIDGPDSTANLSQTRLTDARRLVRKIGTLDEKIFLELKRVLQKELFP